MSVSFELQRRLAYAQQLRHEQKIAQAEARAQRAELQAAELREKLIAPNTPSSHISQVR